MRAKERSNGAVAEWSKAHAWKVCRRETVSRVRIPVAPPPTPVSVIKVAISLFYPDFTGACAVPSAWETLVIQLIRAKSLGRLCRQHHALRLGLIFPANRELTGKFCKIGLI